MRFLMMHRMDETLPEAWNPSPEFIEQMGGMIQDWTERGILITAEGVHPSAKGARVRKGEHGITATDGWITACWPPKVWMANPAASNDSSSRTVCIRSPRSANWVATLAGAQTGSSGSAVAAARNVSTLTWSPCS